MTDIDLRPKGSDDDDIESLYRIPTDRLGTLVQEHPALLLTAAYIALIFIGLGFESFLFLTFKLNIFYFAEAADFLLVPFREPLVVLASVVPIPLWMLYIRIARWAHRKRFLPKPKKRQPVASAVVSVIAVILWSLNAIIQYAQYVSDQIKNGKRRAVDVRMVNGDAYRGPLIGSTNGFLFVYDAAKKQTHVLPVENVAQVVVDSRSRKERAADDAKKKKAAPAQTTPAVRKPATSSSP